MNFYRSLLTFPQKEFIKVQKILTLERDSITRPSALSERVERNKSRKFDAVMAWKTTSSWTSRLAAALKEAHIPAW